MRTKKQLSIKTNTVENPFAFNIRLMPFQALKAKKNRTNLNTFFQTYLN